MLSRLLEKWSSIAPEECKIVRDRASLFIVEFADDNINVLEVEKDFDYGNEKIPSIVLGAVMQCAAKRELCVALRYFHEEKEWGADLYSQDGIEDGKAFECEHKSAAIALLTAYLEYLKGGA